MRSIVMVLAFGLLCLLTTTSLAQKKLSDAETQDFYRLIRLTKEFKYLKEKTDSINKAQGESKIPQEIDIQILKQESATDDLIFRAMLGRVLLGVPLEKYYIKYDKQKKQLVSVEKGEVEMQIQFTN